MCLQYKFSSKSRPALNEGEILNNLNENRMSGWQAFWQLQGKGFVLCTHIHNPHKFNSVMIKLSFLEW